MMTNFFKINPRISVASLIFIIFAILKLAGAITWGWGYVCIPLIINACIEGIIFIIDFIRMIINSY